MTSLIRSPNITPLRRHSDPPKLWLWVLAGSLLIHLVAGATVQNFWVTPVVPANSTAIAVDFLEPIEESVPPPQADEPTQTAENNVSQTTLSTPVEIPVESLATVSQIAPAQPITESSVTIPTRRAPTPTLSPKKMVPSLPADTSTLKPRPKRSAVKAAPIPDESALKKRSVPTGSNTRLPDVPTVPNPLDIKPDTKEDSIGAIVPIAIPPAPAKFIAQFRAIAPASNLSNSSIASTITAQLLGESTQSFSSDPAICLLTPDALSNFGQPVTLKLPLDETGAFNSQKPITVEQSSGNPRYDELAICVTKTSRFTPAYTLEGNTKRAVSSDVEMQVTLIQ